MTDFIKESESIATNLYQQFKNDIIGTEVKQKIETHKNSVKYNNKNYITSSDLVKSKFHQYMEIIRLCSEEIKKHLQEYHQYYEKPDNTLWDWVLWFGLLGYNPGKLHGKKYEKSYRDLEVFQNELKTKIFWLNSISKKLQEIKDKYEEFNNGIQNETNKKNCVLSIIRRWIDFLDLIYYNQIFQTGEVRRDKYPNPSILDGEDLKNLKRSLMGIYQG